MSTPAPPEAAPAGADDGDAGTARLIAAMVARAATEPIGVDTVSLSQGRQHRYLTIHPLAQAIPGASPADITRMHDDIQANGISVPATLFEGKILDGRHRLAIAALTHAPLPIVNFRGDTDAARQYVWSANAARRHLSIPQLGVLALTHFEAAAQDTAAAAAPARPPTVIPASRHPEPWQREVARMAGDPLTPDTVKRLAESRVTQAPRTMRRIASGEIRRVDQAVKAAAAELGIPPARPVPRSPWDRMGCALGDLRAALATLAEDGPGAATRDQILGRTAELRGLLGSIEREIR